MSFNDSKKVHELKEKIFKMMISEKNDNGRSGYRALKYLFYDFQEQLGLTKQEYEQFLEDLYREGLIIIDKGDKGDYPTSTITATIDALDYYTEKN